MSSSGAGAGDAPRPPKRSCSASKVGAQPGFVVVLEQLPDNPRFDREAREQLLEVFRDAAEYWGERRIPFRCFYSFQ